jgi:hypothetical protein
MLIIGCDFHTRYQQIAMAEDLHDNPGSERSGNTLCGLTWFQQRRNNPIAPD